MIGHERGRAAGGKWHRHRHRPGFLPPAGLLREVRETGNGNPPLLHDGAAGGGHWKRSAQISVWAPLNLVEQPPRPARHHPKKSKQLTIIVKPVPRFLIRLHYRRCAPYEIGNQMSFHSVIERAEPAGPPH